MKSYPHLRRWLAAAITAAVLGAVVVITFWTGRSPADAPRKRDEANKAKAAPSCPLSGGSPNPNMVNLVEKDVPPEWNVEKGEEKNIKWAAPLGSRSYAGPVVVDGKVYIGTNRAAPRT